MLVDSDGMPVEQRSAAEVRAELVRAARVYEARLIAGHDEEPSIEAQAGAILEAETAVEIHHLFLIADSWREANTK